MKAHHCDECRWFAREPYEHVCRKQHYPRFYKPKHERDMDWGWKRKCEDFLDTEKAG